MFRALRSAEAALDASRGAGEESEWVRFLDHHYLDAEAALCFRDLGSAAVLGERRARQRHCRGGAEDQ